MLFSLIALLMVAGSLAAQRLPDRAPAAPGRPAETPPPWLTGAGGPEPWDARELITPVSPEPVPIEEALRRRLRLAGRPAKNVILVIPDGMSAEALRLAREVLVGPDRWLALDRFPVCGRVEARCADNPVADSAAAGSALACGQLVPMWRIGVDASGNPLPNWFEVARDAGRRVGIVTDMRLTHATPAAFSAHTENRNDESSIAVQLLGQKFHVLLGGGGNILLPDGVDRPPGRPRGTAHPAVGYDAHRPKPAHPAEQAQAASITAALQDYRVITARAELRTAVAERPERLLGVFSPSHLPYRWEAGGDETPSLAELTAAALDLLSRPPSPGFVLMVEAGRIDVAAHSHDARELVDQVGELDRAVKVMVEFVERTPDTLLVVTADHATGNLAITDAFDARRFRHQATSTQYLAHEIIRRQHGLAEVLSRSGLAPLNIVSEDVAQLARAQTSDVVLTNSLGSLLSAKLGLHFLDPLVQDRLLTHGHHAEDLFVHAMGRHRELFNGVMRQPDIARRCVAALGLSLPPAP